MQRLDEEGLRDNTDDRIRCARSQHYKYIRNLQPERPYMQFNAYKKHQYPAWTLLRVLHQIAQPSRRSNARKNAHRPSRAIRLVDARARPRLHYWRCGLSKLVVAPL